MDTLLWDITERSVRTGVLYPKPQTPPSNLAYSIFFNSCHHLISTNGLSTKEFTEYCQLYQKLMDRGIRSGTHKSILKKIKVVSVAELITLATAAPFDFMRVVALLQINTNLTAFDTWNSIHGGTVSPRATKYIHKLIKKGLVDVLCEGFRTPSLNRNQWDVKFYEQMNNNETLLLKIKDSQMWIAALSAFIMERILMVDDSVTASFCQRLVSEGVLDLFLNCLRNPKCKKSLDVLLAPFYQLGTAKAHFNLTSDFLKAGAVDVLCEVLELYSPITTQRDWAIIHQAVIGISYCPINDHEKKKLFDHPKAIDTMLSVLGNPDANQMTHFRCMGRLYAALGNHSYSSVSDWNKITIFADHLLDVLFGSGLLGLGGKLLSDPITNHLGEPSSTNVAIHHLWRCGDSPKFKSWQRDHVKGCVTGRPIAFWDWKSGSKEVNDVFLPEALYGALFAFTQVTYAHQESFAKVKGFYFNPKRAAQNHLHHSKNCAFCGVEDKTNFQRGRPVIIQNLKTITHNGKIGELGEYNVKKERWCVCVVEEEDKKMKKYNLKKINIALLDDSGEIVDTTTSPTLSRCTGCHFVRYCCAEHQKKDWKRHKIDCKGIKQCAKRSLKCEATGQCFVLQELKQIWLPRIQKRPGLAGLLPIIERGIMMLESNASHLQPAHKVTTVTRSRQFIGKSDYMSNSKSSALLTIDVETWESGKATPKVSIMCDQSSNPSEFDTGAVTVTATSTSSTIWTAVDVGIFSGTTQGFIMYLPVHADPNILSSFVSEHEQFIDMDTKEKKEVFESLLPTVGKIAYAGHSTSNCTSKIIEFVETFPRRVTDHPVCLCSAVKQGKELHVWTYDMEKYTNTRPQFSVLGPLEPKILDTLSKATAIIKTRNNQRIHVVKRAELSLEQTLVARTGKFVRFFRIVVAAGSQIIVVDINPANGSAGIIFDTNHALDRVVSIETMQGGVRFAVLHECGTCELYVEDSSFTICGTASLEKREFMLVRTITPPTVRSLPWISNSYHNVKYSIGGLLSITHVDGSIDIFDQDGVFGSKLEDQQWKYHPKNDLQKDEKRDKARASYHLRTTKTKNIHTLWMEPKNDFRCVVRSWDNRLAVWCVDTGQQIFGEKIDEMIITVLLKIDETYFATASGIFATVWKVDYVSQTVLPCCTTMHTPFLPDQEGGEEFIDGQRYQICELSIYENNVTINKLNNQFKSRQLTSIMRPGINSKGFNGMSMCLTFNFSALSSPEALVPGSYKSTRKFQRALRERIEHQKSKKVTLALEDRRTQWDSIQTGVVLLGRPIDFYMADSDDFDLEWFRSDSLDGWKNSTKVAKTHPVMNTGGWSERFNKERETLQLARSPINCDSPMFTAVQLAQTMCSIPSGLVNTIDRTADPKKGFMPTAKPTLCSNISCRQKLKKVKLCSRCQQVGYCRYVCYFLIFFQVYFSNTFF